jgi:hypothetical protein
MTKIVIQEDCLAPARFIYLEYSGKNPFGVASKIAEMLLPYFGVSSSGVSETDFRWDNSGDPVTFYFTWWVQKSEGLSRWSRQRFDIKVQGNKTKETNEGSFTLQLNASMTTSFESNNPFTRGLFWIYDFIFYSKRRSAYLKDCAEMVYGFRDELKEHFNLQILDKGG